MGSLSDLESNFSFFFRKGDFMPRVYFSSSLFFFDGGDPTTSLIDKKPFRRLTTDCLVDTTTAWTIFCRLSGGEIKLAECQVRGSWASNDNELLMIHYGRSWNSNCFLSASKYLGLDHDVKSISRYWMQCQRLLLWLRRYESYYL